MCLAHLQPCTDLSYSVALWLTRLWDYMTGLVQTSSEETRSWSLSSLSSFSLWSELAYRHTRSIACSCGCHYIFLMQCFYTQRCLCVAFLWRFLFGWLLVLCFFSLLLRMSLYIFDAMFLYPKMFVCCIFMTFPLWLAVGHLSL